MEAGRRGLKPLDAAAAAAAGTALAAPPAAAARATLHTLSPPRRIRIPSPAWQYKQQGGRSHGRLVDNHTPE